MEQNLKERKNVPGEMFLLTPGQPCGLYADHRLSGGSYFQVPKGSIATVISPKTMEMYSAGPSLSFDDEEMTSGVTELEPGSIAFVIADGPKRPTLCIVNGRLRWIMDGLLTFCCVPMYVSKTGKTTYVRPDGFIE